MRSRDELAEEMLLRVMSGPPTAIDSRDSLVDAMYEMADALIARRTPPAPSPVEPVAEAAKFAPGNTDLGYGEPVYCGSAISTEAAKFATTSEARTTHIKPVARLVPLIKPNHFTPGRVYPVVDIDGDSVTYIGDDGRQHFFVKGEWEPAAKPTPPAASEARATREEADVFGHLDAETRLVNEAHAAFIAECETTGIASWKPHLIYRQGYLAHARRTS